MSAGSSVPSVVSGRVISADGWDIGIDVTRDAANPTVGAALLVPATKHERDAWGPGMLDDLVARHFVVMRSDVRGRGDSQVPRAMPSLPPGHLRRVADDVAAALDRVAGLPERAGTPIVLFGEQDTADAVTRVALADARVAGLVLVSPRLTDATVAAATRRLPICMLASKDDRGSLVASAELFRRVDHPAGRFRLVGAVGSGTTMFAAWQYLRREEPTLERWLGAWARSIAVA